MTLQEKIRQSVNCFNSKGEVVKYDRIINYNKRRSSYKERVGGFLFGRIRVVEYVIDNSLYLIYEDKDFTITYDASIQIFRIKYKWECQGEKCFNFVNYTKQAFHREELYDFIIANFMQERIALEHFFVSDRKIESISRIDWERESLGTWS